MFDNLKRSIIYAHVFTVEISKINTYVKRRKWIDTMKRFQ